MGPLTWKGNTGACGQDPPFQPLWQFIRLPVALCSSSEDPVFWNSWFLTPKNDNFLEFRHSKSPVFSPKFQLVSSIFLKNCSSLASIVAKKISSLDPSSSRRTPPPISKSSAPTHGLNQPLCTSAISRYSIMLYQDDIVQCQRVQCISKFSVDSDVVFSSYLKLKGANCCIGHYVFRHASIDNSAIILLNK